MRARSASAALSETFEREPIETYIFLPSGEKTMSRVQCPPLRRRAAPPERCVPKTSAGPRALRSEEHTSELQSLTNLVCRLLLEKKKESTKNASAPNTHAIGQRLRIKRA